MLANQLRALGTGRAALLGLALLGKVLLYTFNPPPFISNTPLILPFPFLVALDLASAAASGIILVECIRILAARSATWWTPKKHVWIALACAVFFLLARVPLAPRTSAAYYRYEWSLAEKKDYLHAVRSLDIAVRCHSRNTQVP